jgi:hypothetical protein
MESYMNKIKLGLFLITVCALASATLGVRADDDDVIKLTANLRGANEVPAINSDATASFRATIHENGSITFTETFKNLTSNAILSHIHFGEVHVAGGVMIWLCGGGQPACPSSTSGTFTGTSVRRMLPVPRRRASAQETWPVLCAPSARERAM